MRGRRGRRRSFRRPIRRVFGGGRRRGRSARRGRRSLRKRIGIRL